MYSASVGQVNASRLDGFVFKVSALARGGRCLSESHLRECAECCTVFQGDWVVSGLIFTDSARMEVGFW